MSVIGQLGMQAAGAAIGTGFGLLQGSINDRRQRRQQEELQKLQIAGQKEMTDYQYQKMLQMWKDTNYSAQVSELNKAGLNPALMYGMSGGGGATVGGGGGGNVSGGNAPSGGGEMQAMSAMGIQMAQTAAQTELLKEQAKNVAADTENKQGVERDNIKADTENKILQQVINTFAGKEAKDVYERVMSPNRSVQSETYLKEMEAKQGLAATIYDLWQSGKLEEKSISEIESIALSNSKSREETRKITKEIDILEENLKGVKLDNVIKDLESKLQTQTGIDKNSPTWMKILGRLFVGLLNK